MGVLKIWDGTQWVESAGATGDVKGPSSSTNNAIARWDGTTGKLVQDSQVILADNGGMTQVRFIEGESGQDFNINPIGTTGQTFTAKGGVGSTSGNGGNATFEGGTGGSTSGDGGNAILLGGVAFNSGNGGDANVTARNGVGTNKNGGDANITAGEPTGSGTAGQIHHKDDVGISNKDEGGTGRLNTRTTREVHTLAAASTSDTTTISIPSGARLLAVCMNINTAVTYSGLETQFAAAFITGNTTTIVSLSASSQNTKVDFIVPNDEKTTATTEIRFTANGIDTFTAGVIEIVAWYQDLTSLADV